MHFLSIINTKLIQVIFAVSTSQLVFLLGDLVFLLLEVKIHHWDILSFVLPCILIFIMQIFTDFSHFRIKSSSSQKQENVLPHLYVWLLEIIGLMQLLDWFCGKKRKALCGGTCVISSWNFYIFFPFTLFKQFWMFCIDVLILMLEPFYIAVRSFQVLILYEVLFLYYLCFWK